MLGKGIPRADVLDSQTESGKALAIVPCLAQRQKLGNDDHFIILLPFTNISFLVDISHDVSNYINVTDCAH